MRTIAALRDERNQKIAAMEQVIDAEIFTDEIRATYDAMGDDVAKISAQIERMEQLEATKAKLSEPEPAVADPVKHARPVAPEAVKTFDTGDDFCCAVVEARLGRKVDSRLDWHDFRAEQRMDQGNKGGFMVPTYLSSEFLSVDPAQTPLLDMVRKIPAVPAHPDAGFSISALDQTGNQHGGVTVSRVGEGQAKPETDFDLRQLEWIPREIAAHIPITDQIDDNWRDVTAFATELLRGAINAARENEIVRGAGGMQMTGFLGHASSISVNRALANSFGFVDMCNMSASLLKRSGQAIWLINQSLEPVVKAMANAAGFLVWQPNAATGAPGTLDGRPVYWHEFTSATGALGDVMLVMPNYYIIKEGAGPFVDVGYINTDFIDNRKRLKIFLRDDGQPWLTAPFALANGATASPFVALDVP